jgi:hypothetical protein
MATLRVSPAPRDEAIRREVEHAVSVLGEVGEEVMGVSQSGVGLDHAEELLEEVGACTCLPSTARGWTRR